MAEPPTLYQQRDTDGDELVLRTTGNGARMRITVYPYGVTTPGGEVDLTVEDAVALISALAEGVKRITR